MSEQISIIDEIAERVEIQTDTVYFDELLDLAVEVCFTEPARFDAKLEAVATTERDPDKTALIQELGLWGLREAFDLTNYPELGLRARMQAGFEKTKQYDLADAIREPKAFSGKRDPEIVDKIAAFGEALLDEAFLCLGDDALSHAERYRLAQTKEERLGIITWLEKRIKRIAEIGREIEEGQSQETSVQYPIRVSPKAIGVFPDINLYTTCLGVSLLAAAFFQKTQTPYVHAGIAESDTEFARYRYGIEIMAILRKSVKLGITVPDDLTMGLTSIANNNFKKVLSDIGYHAAIYAQVDDTEWIQFDLNYNKITPVSPLGDGQSLADIHAQLIEVETYQSGLELMYRDERLQFGGDYLGRLLADGLSELMNESELAALLTESPNDLSVEQIIDRVIAPVFFKSLPEDLSNEVKKRILWPVLHHGTNNKYMGEDKEAFMTFAGGIIEAYVFSDAKDGDITPCIARCKTDRAYLSRRIEDLRFAPLLLYLRMIGEMTRNTVEAKATYPHHTVEVGLPAYRVGAAVLSDFSSYCDNHLGAHFWSTYWPSYVGITEHQDTRLEALHNERIADKVARYALAQPLRYMKGYYIIHQFLEQKEDSRGR